MPDEQGVVRLFHILTLMQNRGVGKLTQQAIAEACATSIRTIARDMNRLRDAGIPFEFSREHGYVLSEGYQPIKLDLTLNETLALLASREAAAGMSGMPLPESAETAYAKVRNLLPEKFKKIMDTSPVDHVAGAFRDYSRAPWVVLGSACVNRKVVEIDHYSIHRNERTRRLVDPYRIVWLGAYCQLIAFCHIHRAVRHFSMDCIHSAKETGENFVPQPGFSLSAYLSGAMGPNIGEPVDIEVVFDKQAAPYVKRRKWPTGCTIAELGDGSVRLSGTVRGLKDIQRELLSWGMRARVIAPDELKAGLRKEARAMLEMYEKDE